MALKSQMLTEQINSVRIDFKDAVGGIQFGSSLGLIVT